MLLTINLVLQVFVSPVKAQTTSPEQLRPNFLGGSNFIFPEQASSSLSPILPQSAAAARLPSSKVVFESYRDGNSEIYIANDDGSELGRLTNNSAADIQPRLNRGGTKIAFASKLPGNYDIYIVNPDGSGLTRLTTNVKDDVNPNWSSDGKKDSFPILSGSTV